MTSTWLLTGSDSVVRRPARVACPDLSLFAGVIVLMLRRDTLVCEPGAIGSLTYGRRID